MKRAERNACHGTHTRKEQVIWRHVNQIGSMKAMQTFTGPYTRRLLGEPTSYGSSEGGLMGPERKIGFVRKAS